MVVEDDHKVQTATPEGQSASRQLPPVLARAAASPPSQGGTIPSFIRAPSPASPAGSLPLTSIGESSPNQDQGDHQNLVTEKNKSKKTLLHQNIVSIV